MYVSARLYMYLYVSASDVAKARRCYRHRHLI